jgi:hypothetical protein
MTEPTNPAVITMENALHMVETTHDALFLVPPFIMNGQRLDLGDLVLQPFHGVSVMGLTAAEQGRLVVMPKNEVVRMQTQMTRARDLGFEHSLAVVELPGGFVHFGEEDGKGIRIMNTMPLLHRMVRFSDVWIKADPTADHLNYGRRSGILEQGLFFRDGKLCSPDDVYESPPVRCEGGVLQFGDDWPGVFFRGDTAFAFGMHLKTLLEGHVDPIGRAVLEGLLSDLMSPDARNLDAVRDLKALRVTKLRPFAECLADDQAVPAPVDEEVTTSLKKG